MGRIILPDNTTYGVVQDAVNNNFEELYEIADIQDGRVEDIESDISTIESSISSIGDASPKGVYATLVALEAAYPTGTTGIYIVSADGHWYYWSGAAWTDGGLYQSTSDHAEVLRLSNVSEEKTMEIDFEIGSITSANGVESSSDTKLRSYALDTQKIQSINVNSAYSIVIFAWQNATYVGVWNGTSFAPSQVTWYNTLDIQALSVAYPTYTFRIVLKKNNDATLAISDRLNVICSTRKYITKTNLTELGYNCVENLVSTIYTGKYPYASNIGASLIFAADASYGYCIIPVTAGNYYSINYIHYGESNFSYFVDADKKSLGKVSAARFNGLEYVYLAPSNAKWMYLCIQGLTSASDIVVLNTNVSITDKHKTSTYPQVVDVKIPNLFIDAINTKLSDHLTRTVYRQIPTVTINANKRWEAYNSEITAPGYTSVEFTCNENESYRLIGVLVGVNDGNHALYFLDSNDALIGTVEDASQTVGVYTTSITTPASCVKIRYTQTTQSWYNSQLLAQIDKGMVKKSQLIIVDAKGFGDYTNLQDAIDACGDSITNPVTIILYPGTYSRLSAKDKYRYISIIGFDRKNTIIQDNSGDYSTPPMELWGEGSVKNITAIATHTDNPTMTGLSQYAYALHMDYGENNYEFDDCDFISYQNAGVGIGVADSSKRGIRFRNCHIIHYGNDGDMGNGALIVHTSEPINGQSSGIYQRFLMENCYLETEYGNVIANIADSASVEDRYDFSFRNNTLYNINGPQAIGIDTMNLNVKSHGNNISTLNYTV